MSFLSYNRYRTWKRRRRLKWKKRWRKNHPGQKFMWFQGTPRFAFKPIGPQTMILFTR